MPVCTEVNLVMTERQGIEIDYCLQCCGVWLDRGNWTSLLSIRSIRLATGCAAITSSGKSPRDGDAGIHSRAFRLDWLTLPLDG